MEQFGRNQGGGVITRGQEIVVNEEVKKRVAEELARIERENTPITETEAIDAFEKLRDSYKINYQKVTDDDVLGDAMRSANTVDQKKILMRYRRLKQEIISRDRPFTFRVTTNYFTMVKKCGPLAKFHDALISSWKTRYAVLTNGGLIQFKAEEMKKDSDLEPQNFKPLCDFVVTEVPEQKSKRPNCFKLIFAKEGQVTREMVLSAPSQQEMKGWMTAFRQHQIDMFAARSKYFEKRLNQMGLSVPRASILIKKGDQAKLEPFDA